MNRLRPLCRSVPPSLLPNHGASRRKGSAARLARYPPNAVMTAVGNENSGKSMLLESLAEPQDDDLLPQNHKSETASITKIFPIPARVSEYGIDAYGNKHFGRNMMFDEIKEANLNARQSDRLKEDVDEFRFGAHLCDGLQQIQPKLGTPPSIVLYDAGGMNSCQSSQKPQQTAEKAIAESHLLLIAIPTGDLDADEAVRKLMKGMLDSAPWHFVHCTNWDHVCVVITVADMRARGKGKNRVSAETLIVELKAKLRETMRRVCDTDLPSMTAFAEHVNIFVDSSANVQDGKETYERSELEQWISKNASEWERRQDEKTLRAGKYIHSEAAALLRPFAGKWPKLAGELVDLDEKRRRMEREENEIRSRERAGFGVGGGLGAFVGAGVVVLSGGAVAPLIGFAAAGGIVGGVAGKELGRGQFSVSYKEAGFKDAAAAKAAWEEMQRNSSLDEETVRRKEYSDGYFTPSGVPVYFGKFKGACPHGTGRLFWPNGNPAIDGEFDMGQLKKGTLIDKRFGIIQGCFSDFRHESRNTIGSDIHLKFFFSPMQRSLDVCPEHADALEDAKGGLRACEHDVMPARAATSHDRGGAILRLMRFLNEFTDENLISRSAADEKYYCDLLLRKIKLGRYIDEASLSSAFREDVAQAELMLSNLKCPPEAYDRCELWACALGLTHEPPCFELVSKVTGSLSLGNFGFNLD